MDERELEQGAMPEQRDEVEQQPASRVKKRKSKRRYRLGMALGIFAIVIVSALISLRIYAQIAGAPPLTVPKATVFLNAEGEQIGDHYISERRYWVSLDDISPNVINATISVEDQDFYSHHGFNIKRIGAAILTNFQSGSKAQGASTLTQQYARNLYLTHEKTWTRKLNEALYAYRLEVFYSKDEILEGYLNTVYYGHGMYGIEAASRFYYGKSASELTLAESSMLAGIPKGPTYYSPVANLEKATNRQHIILTLMHDEGYITAEQKEAAVATTLTFTNSEWKTANSQAPYFLDTAWVEASEILENLGRNIDTGGWEIQTTLKKQHQQAAENAVRDQMPKTSLQAALISIEQQTGYITALVGGRDYASSKFNRVTQAKRQPGSTMKPLLYAAALQQGYNPLTFVDVSQTTLKYDGKEYTPKNINGKYGDDITMAQAIAISDNVYAVNTLDDIGYKSFQRMLDDLKLGVTIDHVPSSALGATNVTLKNMTTSYAIFGNEGKDVTPTTILKITDERGNVLYDATTNDAEQERLMPKQDAFLLTQMMHGMFNNAFNTYLYATGASLSNKLTHPYAAKSGTTDTDQWMIGYSPIITVGVWNGFDEGALNVEADNASSKEVWTQFMETVHAGQDVAFKEPADVTAVEVELKSGKLASEHCTGPTATIYVADEDVPSKSCSPIDKYTEPETYENWWDWLNIFN